MFAARLYKLAAAKVGVPDYKDLVARKLKTAEDLYHYMVDQFNQSRAFFLKVTVVLILLIELVYLFRANLPEFFTPQSQSSLGAAQMPGWDEEVSAH